MSYVAFMVRGFIAPRVLVASACLASIGMLSLNAGAQEHDSAAAQALFDQARELIRQGHVAEACPKLLESNRLDPGIGTQFHLADCYERSGRVASAWATFLDVASQARATSQVDREKLARQRAEKLEPRLPRLVVNVPEGSKTGGLEIRRNGTLVGSAQWGTPMPIDPGEVEITATAPGKQTIRQTLRLEESKTLNYNVPVLAVDPGAAASAASPAPPINAPVALAVAPAGPNPPPQAPSRDTGVSKGHGNTALVLGLAGLGVVGLGVGGVFAVLAKGKDTDSKSHCAPGQPNSCAAAGVELRNDAIRNGNIATVAVVAGGAVLAGAGVLWLLSGNSDEHQASNRSTLRASADVGVNHGSLYLEGSF